MQRRHRRRLAIDGDGLDVRRRRDQPLGHGVGVALHAQQHLQQFHRGAIAVRHVAPRRRLRALRLGHRHAARHRLQHGGAAGPFGQTAAEAAGARQILHRPRVVVGDLHQRLVAQDAVARHVLVTRQPFSPCRHLAQHGEEPGIAAAALDPLPGVHRVDFIDGGIGQRRHFLVEPGAAALRLDPLAQAFVDAAEVGDIAQRVIDLSLAQRPDRPVGEARRLVHVRLGQPGDQCLVADLITETADHGRHLGIEYRRRHAAHELQEDLQILAGGVEHLHRLRCRQQVQQRRQVHPLRQGVDRRRRIRAGDLHQAQLRPERALAHELGIDGHVRAAGELLAECPQGFGVGDQRHGTL